MSLTLNQARINAQQDANKFRCRLVIVECIHTETPDAPFEFCPTELISTIYRGHSSVRIVEPVSPTA